MGCCLLGPISTIIYGIKWCLWLGWKGYLILVIVIITLIVGVVVVTDYGCQHTGGSKSGVPSITAAPWEVETYSRVYVCREVVVDEESGDVTMTDWWEKSASSGKWIEYPGTMVLEKAGFGDIVVSKRK